MRGQDGIEHAGRRPVRVTPRDLELLRRHTWPGNVRELRNVIERACLLGQGGGLGLDEVLGQEIAPPPLGGGATPEPEVPLGLPYKAAKTQVLDGFERAYFKALVERHGGNVSSAAREAQIDRKHLRDLLRKYGLLSSR